MRVATWADPRYGFAAEAERIGVHSLWAPEAWGFDAFTPLAFAAAQTSTIGLGTAIAQIGARTPAMLAMSALSMQVLSQGRFVLGLGTSGPQVMERWHGVSFDRPVARTRETIEVVRAIASGERVGGIRSPIPAPVPIYVASLGPANLRLTGELADGWLGTAFVPETAEVFFEPLRAAGRFDELDISVAVGVEITDDETVLERHARGYAFTFGAMGSATHNFYVDAFSRQGWGDDVREVQRLWLDGRRDEAAARVPLEIARRTNLLGTPDMVKERLRTYRDAGVTTLRAAPNVDAARSNHELDARLEALAHLIELVDEVSAEPSVR